MLLKGAAWPDELKACISSAGFPSVGKSTLLNKLTGTFSEVSCPYAACITFTHAVLYIQGMQQADIQLVLSCCNALHTSCVCYEHGQLAACSA